MSGWGDDSFGFAGVGAPVAVVREVPPPGEANSGVVLDRRATTVVRYDARRSGTRVVRFSNGGGR